MCSISIVTDLSEHGWFREQDCLKVVWDSPENLYTKGSKNCRFSDSRMSVQDRVHDPTLRLYKRGHSVWS